jgi:predicted lipoprotein with Yx(FWY)xxD motif
MRTRRGSGRDAAAVALAVTGAVLIAGCGNPSGAGSSGAGSSGSGSSGSGSGGPKVTIRAESVHGAGTVLVNAQGYALYMFVPDHQRQVTCTGYCAQTWPPVKLPASATLAAGPGVQSSLLGSDVDPAGGRVVTYDGWPLYGYTGDVQADQDTGQAIDLNGGYWYLIRPSGKPLETQPQ